MLTKSNSLPSYYKIKNSGILYEFLAFDIKRDFNKVLKWMHEPHVIPQWQLNKDKIELGVYFEKMIIDDHQKLFIIKISGRSVGYLEIYEAKRDRLSLYYDADEHDMGWHILLGESDVVGKGHFRTIMRMICFFIFENSFAEKIVGEPDVNVKSYQYVADQIAFESQGVIDMLEKKATLYHCYRKKFYQLHSVYPFDV
ncbi:UNVERIFIED_CONTAM: acetyltransferase [Acinetobacter baumannii]|uniref:GNAT family N-acetyltransferase n=1 Tax=Acinetobacter gerneri TaxID=202952 RepID=UPI0032149B5B|nr:acetyltransferase [Acinetobacter baumannii]